MLVIDGHLDLAMNALNWNRDLKKSVSEIRRAESGMKGKGRGMNTVSLPEMKRGEVCACLATLIARVRRGKVDGYASKEIAYAAAHGQFAYYRILETQGLIRMIRSNMDLKVHVEGWLKSPEQNPIGVILSMEGADPILDPDHLEYWWNIGLRVLSLTHYGENDYAHGTGSQGGLKPLGRKLLEAMYSLGMVLDVTHLSEESFWDALEAFQGHIIASHSNCRALVPGDRQLSDEQIKALIERDAVIGVALDAWMLYPGWIKGVTSNEVVSLEAVADQIEHIVDLAGDTRHVAIGSDLDGGFGKEQCPHDLDTIADLQKIPSILKKRGYSDQDIRNVMYENWLRKFGEALPTKK